VVAVSPTSRPDFIGRPASYRLAVRGAELASGFVGLARRTLHKQEVEVVRDVAYAATGHPQQRLDVFLPKARTTSARGAIVYVHGGAFQYLSRRTHAHIAMRFALEGFVVFNMDYRLAPLNPYPACMEDASAAMVWIARHADQFGVDSSRLVIAGESAGANIAVTVAVAGSIEQRAPWARRLFNEVPRLRGCIAACGVFCVDDPHWRESERAKEASNRKIFRSMKERFDDPWNYSGVSGFESMAAVRILESSLATNRPLPELFAFVGGRDPVEEDTRRVVASYRGRGAHVIAHAYPGQRHAFHALSLGSASRDVWRRQLAFAARSLR